MIAVPNQGASMPRRSDTPASDDGVQDAQPSHGNVGTYLSSNPLPARTEIGQNLLTRDEARRIAANIAKLPELLRKP